MFVAVCELHLLLTDHPRSLKEKRFVLRSLKDRIRRRFNVAVAEVGDGDLWQSALLGIASVANEKRQAEAVIAKVMRFVESSPDLEVAACRTEVV